MLNQQPNDLAERCRPVSLLRWRVGMAWPSGVWYEKEKSVLMRAGGANETVRQAGQESTAKSVEFRVLRGKRVYFGVKTMARLAAVI